MFSHGVGDDDNGKRSSCPLCNEYLLQAEQAVESVDSIERRLNEIKEFFASREWVIIENVANINGSRDPLHDIDLESLRFSYNQNIRFKRIVDSTLRALDRIKDGCDHFGGVDGNR